MNKSIQLSCTEQQRYSRHFLLKELGEEGQLRLKNSRVLVIGVGGLGSPAALYLAAAGVGKLGLVDFDKIELSNLQRQILYNQSEVNLSKVKIARNKLSQFNPDIEIELFEERLEATNVERIFKNYDYILDGTDNFATRFLINDACVLYKKTNIHGSISKFEGQLSIFSGDEDTACYRCLYPEPPPPGKALNCSQEGVLGVLPGIVGTLQAAETIKLIAGIGEPLRNRLLKFDALKMTFSEFKLQKDPDCPVCSTKTKTSQLENITNSCPTQPQNISVVELAQKLASDEEIILIDVREVHEYKLVNLSGQLIPLGALESRIPDLDPFKKKTVVVMCHHGGRSAFACQILRANGFTNVSNLTGGINQWAIEIDPSMPKY